MTVEVAIVISAISLVFGICSIVSGIKHRNRNETKEDVTQLTTVIVKLESIGDDIKEIKTDMKGLKLDVQNHAERLIKVEQQLKVLNKTVFPNTRSDD